MVGDGGGVDHTKGGRAGVVVGCEVGGHVGAVGVEVEEGGQDVEEEVHGNIDRIEWSKIRRLVRKLSKQDSVPKKQKVVRYSPSGTWSALNGYTSSNELGAQYV